MMSAWTGPQARAAAFDRWAREADPTAALAPARAAFLARFERQVDPDNQLHPAERRVRADRALRAHMIRLAEASAIARANRKRTR
jgi:hypothetical protein